MSGWRVIGIGSPFGDDRAGWVVLEQLAQHSLPENVELITLDRPGPDLINWLEQDVKTVLIDAMQTTAFPTGHWMPLDLDQLDSSEDLSSHGFGLAPTLKLAQALGSLPHQLRLFGICIAPRSSQPEHNTLSSSVMTGAGQLSTRLAEQIAADSDARYTATGSGGVGSIGSSSRSDCSRR
jgi:hydrogenase maturation protease